MKPKAKNEEFKRKMALRFLQYCGMEIEELTPEAWQVFKCIDVSIYTIPLVKRDHANGTKIGTLCNRYQMSYAQIRRRIDTETWVGAAVFGDGKKK